MEVINVIIRPVVGEHENRCTEGKLVIKGAMVYFSWGVMLKLLAGYFISSPKSHMAC